MTDVIYDINAWDIKNIDDLSKIVQDIINTINPETNHYHNISHIIHFVNHHEFEQTNWKLYDKIHDIDQWCNVCQRNMIPNIQQANSIHDIQVLRTYYCRINILKSISEHIHSIYDQYYVIGNIDTWVF